MFVLLTVMLVIVTEELGPEIVCKAVPTQLKLKIVTRPPMLMSPSRSNVPPKSPVNVPAAVFVTSPFT